MRISVVVVPLDSKGPEIHLRLPQHAVIRALAFAPKKRLVMTAAQPDYVETPVAFVELDPDDGELHPRRYVVLSTGMTMTVPDGAAAKWCASGISLDGQRVVHLFEIVPVS